MIYRQTTHDINKIVIRSVVVQQVYVVVFVLALQQEELDFLLSNSVFLQIIESMLTFGSI